MTSEEYKKEGTRYYLLGKLTQAINSYNQAIALDPSYASAYNDRAIVYQDQGKVEKAMADYNKAIALSPTNAYFYTNRGTVYAAQGNWEEAIADYDKSISLDRNVAHAYNNRGTCYKIKGQHAHVAADYIKEIEFFNKAITDHNHAIALNPKDAAYYTNRGNTYRAQGKEADAIADYIIAMELDPANKIVATRFKLYVRNQKPSDILEKIRSLPKAKEIAILNKILDHKTHIGKWFKPSTVRQNLITLFNVTSPYLTAKLRYKKLTDDQVNIRRAARLLSQGVRTNTFYGVPAEIGVVIASKVAQDLNEEIALDIAREYFTKPKIK